MGRRLSLPLNVLKTGFGFQITSKVVQEYVLLGLHRGRGEFIQDLFKQGKICLCNPSQFDVEILAILHGPKISCVHS